MAAVLLSTSYKASTGTAVAASQETFTGAHRSFTGPEAGQSLVLWTLLWAVLPVLCKITISVLVV